MQVQNIGSCAWSQGLSLSAPRLVDRANQVWASDITYIPMARGFLYLAGVMDWFARRMLAWRLSITLGVDFCIDAVEEALRLHGRPEIFNSDQGSQFTSDAFTDVLITKGIPISMFASMTPALTRTFDAETQDLSNCR